MGPIWEAFRLFAKHRRLWQYALKPQLITAAIFFVLLLIAWLLVVAPIQSSLANLLPGKESEATMGALRGVSYFVVFGMWLILAALLYIAVATMMSALLWERLSLEVETILYGDGPSKAHPMHVIAVDSGSRLFLVFSVGLLSLCASAIPFLPVFMAGYPATLDYTATAYSRRGVMLRGQMRSVYRVPGIWPFHLMASLISVIPIVNLLMLPIMVTAGTILVVRHERGMPSLPPR